MGHDTGSKCYVSSKYGKLYWTVGGFDLVLELSITVLVFSSKLHCISQKSSVMESNQKVELELINMAIQRLVEEKKIKEASSTDCLDDQLLLSKLLSQVYLITSPTFFISLILSFYCQIHFKKNKLIISSVSCWNYYYYYFICV